ncbi:36041_t:CDS:2, partial [Racocetra persica]
PDLVNDKRVQMPPQTSTGATHIPNPSFLVPGFMSRFLPLISSNALYFEFLKNGLQ